MSLQYVREQIEKRTRFSQIENYIDVPQDPEIDAAIFDAVAEINSAAPETSYTVESIFESTDPRWLRLLCLGAAKNVVQLLIFDWSGNEVDVDFGDGVTFQSKLDNYRSLYDKLSDEFHTRLDELKKSSMKISKVSTFPINRADTMSTIVHTRRLIYRKSVRR